MNSCIFSNIFFSKEFESKGLSLNRMMLSKEEDNGVAERNWEKLLFAVLQHEKQSKTE